MAAKKKAKPKNQTSSSSKSPGAGTTKAAISALEKQIMKDGATKAFRGSQRTPSAAGRQQFVQEFQDVIAEGHLSRTYSNNAMLDAAAARVANRKYDAMTAAAKKASPKLRKAESSRKKGSQMSSNRIDAKAIPRAKKKGK